GQTQTKMADLIGKIDEVAAEAQRELAAVKDAQELEQFRIKYLGSKGKFKELMSLLAQVPREQKPAFGQKANTEQSRIKEAFEKTQTKMADLIGKIDEVAAEAQRELAAVKDAQELEQFRIKYLGSKGKFKELMSLLAQVPREQKPAFGQKANTEQSRIKEAFE